MPIAGFQIGECPKCAGRTFVVYAIVGFGGKSSLKGKCYKCNYVADIAE